MAGKYLINVLNSGAQLLKGLDPKKDRLVLGLDSEILVTKGTKILWPHEQKCPQERGALRWASEGCDWHGDGYAFELCVNPTPCLDMMLLQVTNALRFMQRQVPGVNMTIPTVYAVPGRVVATAPEEVKRLGCAPSFNVYDDPGDPKSLSDDERTTGCHLHVSHHWLDNENAKSCVKWADITVGNTWNYLSGEDPKVEAGRRKAYGRAGEHRRNIYPNGVFGFEYRVLPGMALGHPAMLTLMFNLVRHAVHMAALYGEPDPALSTAARAAINTADKKLSKAILDQLPFEAQSRKFLEYLAKHPLKVLSMTDWIQWGGVASGHQSLAHTLAVGGKI